MSHLLVFSSWQCQSYSPFRIPSQANFLLSSLSLWSWQVLQRRNVLTRSDAQQSLEEPETVDAASRSERLHWRTLLGWPEAPLSRKHGCFGLSSHAELITSMAFVYCLVKWLHVRDLKPPEWRSLKTSAKQSTGLAGIQWWSFHVNICCTRLYLIDKTFFYLFICVCVVTL